MSAKVNATNVLKSKLLDRYAKDIEGILGCYDRLIITGRLVDVGHPNALTALLRRLNIRCFDLGVFAEPLRDQVRDNALRLARQAGLEIQYLERKGLRKEARGAEMLERRGRHPGLVHIFSAMEACQCFKPWHDEPSGRAGLKLTGGRCLHYSFYFIDERLLEPPAGRVCAGRCVPERGSLAAGLRRNQPGGHLYGEGPGHRPVPEQAPVRRPKPRATFTRASKART